MSRAMAGRARGVRKGFQHIFGYDSAGAAAVRAGRHLLHDHKDAVARNPNRERLQESNQ